MKSGTVILAVFLVVSGTAFSNLASAQTPLGGPKKQTAVGGPAKQYTIGGPPKPRSTVLPTPQMVVSAAIEPLTFVLQDDGLVPNNRLPFLVYKQAIAVDNAHPEKTIEGLFGANGWGDMWRNGVYDYLHYHSTVHEALGVARGHARVRFGGNSGKEVEISAGAHAS